MSRSRSASPSLVLVPFAALALVGCSHIGDNDGSSSAAGLSGGGEGFPSGNGTPGSGASGADGSTGTPTGSGASGQGGDGSQGGQSSTGGAGQGGASTSSSSTGGSSGQGGSMIGGNYNCDPPSGSPPNLKLTEVAGSLSSPLLIKGAPGDDERLYISERDGRIKILKNGSVSSTAFLNISSKVQGGGEQGLLGFAFHPQYAQNGRFFVHYSVDGSGDTRIEEYVRSSNPDVAEATPVKTVLEVDQPYSNHNGGSIEFGGDGMLYIFLGDGGSGGDPGNRAQNLDSLLGKVLRIDVSGTPYSIPSGNIVSGADEIWDYGLRNPYRASFDPCTGDLYIGDVGQNAWEEVDVEPAGSGNRNYGWRLKEGNACYSPSSGCDNASLTAPAVVYDNNPGSAVIGGYVYRGSAIPGLRGTYFYGDNGSGQIWSFVWSGGNATAQTSHTNDLGSDALSIASFGQDNSGEVYVVHLSGTIYRIDAE